MQKRIGHVMALTIAAGMLAAIAPAASFAQDEGSSIVPAVSRINANKVDGKHAVGANASRAKRRGKLVATNKQGYLPSNIVKPAWHLILGTPAGFADGVDDGVTGMIVTKVAGASVNVAALGTATATAVCPALSVVIGGGMGGTGVVVEDSYPSNGTNGPANGWFVRGRDTDNTAGSFIPWAMCLTVDPAEPITVAKKGKIGVASRER